MANDGLITIGIVPDDSQWTRTMRNLANNSGRTISQAINAHVQPLGRITGEANEFQKSLAASNARVIAFGASAGAIYAIRTAFQHLIKSTIDVERQMTEINAVFQLGGQNLRKFAGDLFSISNAYSVSFSEATKAAAEFARQGLTVEETLKRTAAAVSLSRISNMNMEQSVTSLTSILNTFVKESLDAEEVVNRLVAVDQAYAVSSGDLAEALSRVSSSAADANVSLNQTMGLITAAKQITARSASVLGNSFKTMFTRLQRPQVIDDLEAVGIKARTTEGKLRPMIEILRELSTTYDGLGSAQKSFIAETVGGVYQINILKAIMRDLGSGMSIYTGAVDAAAHSTDFVQKRMEILNETISSQLIRTANNLTQAFSNVGNALFGTTMRTGLGSFDKLASSVGKYSNPTTATEGSGPERFMANSFQGGLKGIGNFLRGPGVQLTMIVITKLFQRLLNYAIDAAKELSGVSKKEKERETINKAIAEWLSTQKDLLKGITDGQISLTEAAAQYVTEMKDAVATAKSLKSISSSMGEIAVSQVSFIPSGKASGYIPNLEIAEARRGGYQAGNIINTTINNGRQKLNIMANDAESLTRVSSGGSIFDFVNPPASSSAGRRHKQESLAQTGIDPYSLPQVSMRGKGFVPNLALSPELVRTIMGLGIKPEDILKSGNATKMDAFTDLPNNVVAALVNRYRGDSRSLTGALSSLVRKTGNIPESSKGLYDMFRGFMLNPTAKAKGLYSDLPTKEAVQVFVESITGQGLEQKEDVSKRVARILHLRPDDIQKVLNLHGKSLPFIAAYESSGDLRPATDRPDLTTPLEVTTGEEIKDTYKFKVPTPIFGHKTAFKESYHALLETFKKQANAKRTMSPGEYGKIYGAYFDYEMRARAEEEGVKVGEEGSALDIYGPVKSILAHTNIKHKVSAIELKASAAGAQDSGHMAEKIFRTLAGEPGGKGKAALKGPVGYVPPLSSIREFNASLGGIGIIDADKYGEIDTSSANYQALIYAAVASGKPLRVHYGPMTTGKTTAAERIVSLAGGMGKAGDYVSDVGQIDSDAYKQFIINKTDQKHLDTGVFGLALSAASQVRSFYYPYSTYEEKRDEMIRRLKERNRGKEGANAEAIAYKYNRATWEEYGSNIGYLGQKFGARVKPYSEENPMAAGGFIPNLAPVHLGSGAYGKFYDLGRKLGGTPIGKKVFSPRTEDKDIVRELQMAKAVSGVRINPLFSFPKAFGNEDRAVKRRSIGKEVFKGSTLPQHLNVRPNDFYNQFEQKLWLKGGRMSDFSERLQILAFKQLQSKGINADDLIGNSGNSMFNDKALDIIERLTKDEDRYKTLRTRLKSKPNILEDIAASMSRKGARMGIIDPGLFSFLDSDAASGFVPNLRNAVEDALSRENKATGGRAILSRHPLLKTIQNPFGLAAIDSRYQKDAGQAISQHTVGMGQSISQVRSAHTARGFIPNLVQSFDSTNINDTGGLFSSSGIINSVMLALLSQIRQTEPGKVHSGDTSKVSGVLSYFTSEGGKAAAKIRLLTEESEKLRETIISGGEAVTSFGKKFKGMDSLEKFDAAYKAQITPLRPIATSFEDKTASRAALYSKIGLRGAAAASIGGGFATQFAELASPTIGAAVNEFSSGMTQAGQALMAFPSKLGMIGAISLTFGAVVSAIDVWGKGLHNARRAFEISNAKYQKLNSQIDALNISMNQYESLILDSSVGLEAIQREQRKYAENLAEMSQTPEGKKIASRLASAPDTKTRMSILMEEKERGGRAQDFQASMLSLREYATQRKFIGSGLLGINPLGYSNVAQKTQIEHLVRGGAGTAIGYASSGLKDILSTSDTLSSLDKFNQALEDATSNLDVDIAKSAGDIKAAFDDLEKILGKNGVAILKGQMISQIKAEKINDTPERQAAQMALRNRNAERQERIEAAVNQARTSQRFFVNSGALKAGNLLDMQGAANQAALNRALVLGPNSTAQRQAMTGVYKQQYGERTVRQYETATELKRIEAERQFKVNQVQGEATRSIVGSLTQDFDSRIKNLDLYKNAGSPGQGLPVESDFRIAFTEALNKGISEAVKGGNFSRFVNKSGTMDLDSMRKSIAGSSSVLDMKMQSNVLRYLQANSSIDIMKAILDANKQTVTIGQESLTESQKAVISLKGLEKEMDFRQLSNYMGGIKNLMDRSSRRTMERNLSRGTFLMEKGRTSEARAYGAQLVLSTFKEMKIPIDTTKNTPLSRFMKRAWEIEERNLGALQSQSVGRVVGSVSRTIGGRSIAAQGMRELASGAGIATARAAMQAELQPENARLGTGAMADIESSTTNLNTNLFKAGTALENFAKSIDTSKETLIESLKNLGIIRKTEEKNMRDDASQTYGELNKNKRRTPNVQQGIGLPGAEDSRFISGALVAGKSAPTGIMLAALSIGMLAYQRKLNKNLVKSLLDEGRSLSTSQAGSSVWGGFKNFMGKERHIFKPVIAIPKQTIEKPWSTIVENASKKMPSGGLYRYPDAPEVLAKSKLPTGHFLDNLAAHKYNKIASELGTKKMVELTLGHSGASVTPPFPGATQMPTLANKIASYPARFQNIISKLQKMGHSITEEGIPKLSERFNQLGGSSKAEKIMLSKGGKGAFLAMALMGLGAATSAKAGEVGEGTLGPREVQTSTMGGRALDFGIGTTIGGFLSKTSSLSKIAALAKGAKGAGIDVASDWLREGFTEKQFGYKAGLGQGMAGAVAGGMTAGGPIGAMLGGGAYATSEAFKIKAETDKGLSDREALDRMMSAQMYNELLGINKSNPNGTPINESNAKMKIRKMQESLTGRSNSLKSLQDADKEDFRGIVGTMIRPFSKKQFNEKAQELQNLTQEQRSALSYAEKSGDVAQMVNVLKVIQEQLARQAQTGETRDVLAPTNNAFANVNHNMKVDISVKDFDKIPTEIKDNILMPMIQQINALQIQINELVNQKTPRPAAVK